MSHYKPLSLTQHFEAPEGYVGCFGWICGYSADESFLDKAVERFTRATDFQRANEGKISLAVFLDPSKPSISIQNAPGVAHCLMDGSEKKKFRLLHAKVAILGFQHLENSAQWKLRLLVSTGNWTRQTLEKSLDLIWRIDISSESLYSMKDDIAQDCADIKSAWSLMQYIQKVFNTTLLGAFPTESGRISDTKNAIQQVTQWIQACSKEARGEPRFFDNRSQSLLKQLPEKINANGKAARKNYLAMGSGFYESSGDSLRVPKVPLEIISCLKDNGLLTKTSTVDIYVNPMACQAIATAKKALVESGINIRPGATSLSIFGKGVQRTLHAKFLFSANYLKSSESYSKAWVYLGSGNLTHPGFQKTMRASDGNLEAGVVFFPPKLYREKAGMKESEKLSNFLPVQWDSDFNESLSDLKAGADMEEPDVMYIAPPVTCLHWSETDDEYGQLDVNDTCTSDIQVLDLSGEICKKINTGFVWRNPQPRQVYIRWETPKGQQEAAIPVVDQYGRIAATALPDLDIEEAWWKLTTFPVSAHEGDEDDGDEENDEVVGTNSHRSANNQHVARVADYSIRTMMELIERIAAKQTEVKEDDWVCWCTRLEQILGQTKDSEFVTYFRDDLKLNPLSPLWNKPFRPSFADSSNSKPGRLYEDALSRIEKHWKVQSLGLIRGEI